jgi:hypothetical protein
MAAGSAGRICKITYGNLHKCVNFMNVFGKRASDRLPRPVGSGVKVGGIWRNAWALERLQVTARLFGGEQRGEGVEGALGDGVAHGTHQFLVVVQVVPG